MPGFNLMPLLTPTLANVAQKLANYTRRFVCVYIQIAIAKPQSRPRSVLLVLARPRFGTTWHKGGFTGAFWSYFWTHFLSLKGCETEKQLFAFFRESWWVFQT